MKGTIMNKRSRYGGLAPLILAAIQILASQAYSQSKEIDTAELTNRAEVVAVGKVTSLRSEWSEGRRRIVTRATIVIDEYLKGEQRAQHSRSFHSLRHSLTSTLANADVSEEIRRRITGHESAAVHSGYTHHERKTLARAVEKMPSV